MAVKEGLLGAVPVFVDIDPVTFNLDPALVESAVTEKTRAIIPVHLFGQPCDMDPILAVARKHGLRVIEDCAQAFGARYKGRLAGTLGDAGCFSFFPSKNLACYGDGGLVITADAAVDAALRVLRNHARMSVVGNDWEHIHDAFAAALGQAVRSHERRYQAATAIVMAPD